MNFCIKYVFFTSKHVKEEKEEYWTQNILCTFVVH